MDYRTRILTLIAWTAAMGTFTPCAATINPFAHLDMFHLGDADNDTQLTMDECASIWKTFDVDQDDMISKVEFIMRWTFANLPDAHSTPLFLRLVDNDFSGTVSQTEVNNLCKFFDDDEDLMISQFEFDFTWKGLFRVTQDDFSQTV